ncbi:hypothetical protein B4U80_14893 [Leptotrombidium deliense]|uniref:Uncharacterized protein n=1 Tax=Leptotrombidium deliense TaxID=299467 RepID=A0A443S543_9ACAR|nr:hypothetical protein B4U80_14893 [Leptotrombidium deliense]
MVYFTSLILILAGSAYSADILFYKQSHKRCTGKNFTDIGFVPMVPSLKCLFLMLPQCEEPQEFESKFYIYDFKNFGCSTPKCNHRRILELLVVDHEKHGECQPVAYRCKDYYDFIHGNCASCENNGCQLFGYGNQIVESVNIKQPFRFTIAQRWFSVNACQDVKEIEINYMSNIDEKFVLLNRIIFKITYTYPCRIRRQYSTRLCADGDGKLFTQCESN